MAIATAFREVLGAGNSFWPLLASLLGAAWFAPHGSPLRRYAALIVLLLSCTRISLPTTSWALYAVLPTFQPWRLLFWPIPMAALAAGGVLTLLACTGAAPARRTLTGAGLLILACTAFFGPTSTLRPENGVRIDWPGLKVPEAAFILSQKISAESPGRSIVLGPDIISTWITVARGHDYPYLNRLFWANRLGARLGWRESQKRWMLMQYVGGTLRYSMAPAALEQLLRDREIAVVVFRRGAAWSDEIRGITKKLGGEKILVNEHHEVWSRFPVRQPPRSQAEAPTTIRQKSGVVPLPHFPES